MYLVHSLMADSTFGQVLQLRSVCWLDISVSFRVSHAVTTMMPDVLKRQSYAQGSKFAAPCRVSLLASMKFVGARKSWDVT